MDEKYLKAEMQWNDIIRKFSDLIPGSRRQKENWFIQTYKSEGTGFSFRVVFEYKRVYYQYAFNQEEIVNEPYPVKIVMVLPNMNEIELLNIGGI